MNTSNFPRRKETKRKEALLRQAAYDALSNEEKLARLDRANLRAERERYRINSRIAKAKEEAVAAQTKAEAKKKK